MAESTSRVYVVVSNSDRTEGRGYPVCLSSCASKATALRLAKGAGVQGCDAEVFEDVAINLDGKWYVRGSIVSPSPDDLKVQEAMNKYEKALEDAKRLGLTDDQVQTLRGGPPRDTYA